MQRRYSASGLFQQIPPLHLLLSSVILGAITFIGLQQPGQSDMPTGRIQVSLPTLGEQSGLLVFKTPVSGTVTKREGQAASSPVPAAPRAGSAAVPQPNGVRHTYEVKAGDTLSAIFDQLTLSYETMQALLVADENHLALGNLQPGQELWFDIGDSGVLTGLQVKLTPANWLSFTLVDDAYEVESIVLEGEWRERVSSGEINGSFYQSAISQGLSAAQIQQIANLFRWKLNFKRDLRAGDRYHVLLAAEYIDGELSGNSEVRAVILENKGLSYAAFLNDDGRYYDEEGQSMEQSFLLSPAPHNYPISSGFDPRRRHPVTGRIQPHNGTDFVTPIGTKVLATADGVVTKAGRHPLAGNYVEIKHGRKYKTRYLHLSRILVKEGQPVGRGQNIGLSGNTGRSTGPHIHYELHINDRPVNPMRAKLPRAEGLTAELLPRFEQVKARYRSKFERFGLEIAAN